MDPCEKIEISIGGNLFAVHTSDGIAIYNDLDSAINDLRSNDVVVTEGDEGEYAEHNWRKLNRSVFKTVNLLTQGEV